MSPIVSRGRVKGKTAEEHYLKSLGKIHGNASGISSYSGRKATAVIIIVLSGRQRS